jgi:hypothetical protein
VESDRLNTVRKLARAHSVLTKTIRAMPHNDRNQSKKSARWATKFFNADMKKERVRTSEEFLAMARHHLMSMLDINVTMDDSDVLFHTPEIKQQSKQWLVKSMPEPIKS